jgi:hypothetical protein
MLADANETSICDRTQCESFDRLKWTVILAIHHSIDTFVTVVLLTMRVLQVCVMTLELF